MRPFLKPLHVNEDQDSSEMGDGSADFDSLSC